MVLWLLKHDARLQHCMLSCNRHSSLQLAKLLRVVHSLTPCVHVVSTGRGAVAHIICSVIIHGTRGMATSSRRGLPFISTCQGQCRCSCQRGAGALLQAPAQATALAGSSG